MEIFGSGGCHGRNGGGKGVGDRDRGAAEAETEGVSVRQVHWVVGSQIREEVPTGAKKAAAAAAAEGIEAVVLVAAIVVMALADISGNDGAGNGGKKRGINGATTINQNLAGVEAKMAVVMVSENGGGIRGSKMAGADRSYGHHGHCPIYSRGCCSTWGSTIANKQQYFRLFFGVCRSYLHHK